MTASIVEALKLLENRSDSNFQPNKSDSTATKEPSLDDPALGKPISHGQIIDTWEHFKSTGHDEITLEGLLGGASIYVPPPPQKPEPTNEYKALMARLRRDEEERSYQRMLQKAHPRESFAERFPRAPMAHSFAEVNKPSKASDLGDDDIEFGDVQKQITLIINFLVSIFGCAAALWKLAQWWPVSARLFLSLGGAIVVAIAEVAVYSAWTWRMGEGSKKQEKMAEVKDIVKTWVVGEDVENESLEERPQLLKPDDAGLDTNLRKRIKGPAST
ncbi:Uu.00g143320.m01.CDS01 [Anthostomella pinea]|uniref:Uu.00g143320.m01.CDS01 n=1 Tax=Anthostomella pinea TaxID=933095 RepID=A0AAI8VQR5_9PEZI|nr:Uu.00g143320.m01.CDS01 [Anthostomella pinea]